MQITVNIYASLRSYMHASEELFREKEWEVPREAAVSHVLERLKLPKQVHVTVLVNNNIVSHDATLKEGDVVHILPQMSGG